MLNNVCLWLCFCDCVCLIFIFLNKKFYLKLLFNFLFNYYVYVSKYIVIKYYKKHAIHPTGLVIWIVCVFTKILFYI